MKNEEWRAEIEQEYFQVWTKIKVDNVVYNDICSPEFPTPEKAKDFLRTNANTLHESAYVNRGMRF